MLQLQPLWQTRIQWFNELREEKKLLKIIKGEHFEPEFQDLNLQRVHYFLRNLKHHS